MKNVYHSLFTLLQFQLKSSASNLIKENDIQKFQLVSSSDKLDEKTKAITFPIPARCIKQNDFLGKDNLNETYLKLKTQKHRFHRLSPIYEEGSEGVPTVKSSEFFISRKLKALQKLKGQEDKGNKEFLAELMSMKTQKTLPSSIQDSQKLIRVLKELTLFSVYKVEKSKPPKKDFKSKSSQGKNMLS